MIKATSAGKIEISQSFFLSKGKEHKVHTNYSSVTSVWYKSECLLIESLSQRISQGTVQYHLITQIKKFKLNDNKSPEFPHFYS